MLVETEADVDALEVEDPTRIAYLTQTTLSVDETAAIIGRLREKFPAITGPRTDDICYATTNRQLAVKQMAEQCDLVLVIGSKNSSNSNRLVDVARDRGAASHLIDNETEVREEWLEGVRVVGISSGASAPEELVARLVDVLPRRAAPRTCPSSRSCARTCGSCCRRRSGSSWRLGAEPRAQLVAVLVELRRRSADPRPLAVEAQRRRRQRVAARLLHRLHAELGREREGLGDVVDRAGGDRRGAQRLDPLRGGPRPQHGLELRAQRVGVGDARAVGGEALVARQRGQAERLAQAREEPVVADRDGDRPVGGRRTSRTA